MEARERMLVEVNKAFNNLAPSTATAEVDIAKLTEDLEKAIKNTWPRDKKFYRIALVTLAALAIIAAGGALALAFFPKATMPESLIAIGSAAVGALVGLFAKSPNNS